MRDHILFWIFLAGVTFAGISGCGDNRSAAAAPDRPPSLSKRLNAACGASYPIAITVRPRGSYAGWSQDPPFDRYIIVCDRGTENPIRIVDDK